MLPYSHCLVPTRAYVPGSDSREKPDKGPAWRERFENIFYNRKKKTESRMRKSFVGREF